MPAGTTGTLPTYSTTLVYTTNLCPAGLTSRDFCQGAVNKTKYPDGSTTETAWAWEQNFPGAPSGGVVNPYVQYTANTPAGTGQANGSKVLKDSNGNTTTYSEWDWFSAGNLNRNGNGYLVSLPTNPGPLRTTTTSYYEQTGNAPSYWTGTGGGNTWLTLRAVETVNVGSASTIYRYDNPLTTANLGQIQQLDTSQTSQPAYINTLFTYLSDGTLSTVTDPNGNVTTFSYNGYCANLYPSQVKVASNSSVSRTTNYNYNCYAGLVSSATDDNNVTDTYTYDYVGRQILDVQSGSNVPSSRSIQTVYDDVDLITTSTQVEVGGMPSADATKDRRKPPGAL